DLRDRPVQAGHRPADIGTGGEQLTEPAGFRSQHGRERGTVGGHEPTRYRSVSRLSPVQIGANPGDRAQSPNPWTSDGEHGSIRESDTVISRPKVRYRMLCNDLVSCDHTTGLGRADKSNWENRSTTRVVQ